MLKYHLEPINFLAQLRTPFTSTLIKKGSPLDGTVVKMAPFRKGFKLTWPDNGRFRDKRFELGKSLKFVGLHAYDKEIAFRDLFITAHHTDSDLGVSISATGDYLHSAGFRESASYYFQVLIPTDKKLDTDQTIAQHTFESDLGYRSRDSIVVKLGGDELQECFIKHDGRFYLSIDSGRRQSYSQFSKKVHALKNGLGYVTGYLAADAGCFFAYTGSSKEKYVHFYYTEWRNAIKSSYQPLWANPYGFVRQRKLADNIYKKKMLRPMTSPEFSGLCQRLYDSTIFTGVIILMLEASVASLLFMPGGFAIAMETLAGLILNQEKKSSRP